jgi:serine protease Do
VFGVSPGSPAQLAGLQPWDVVRAVDGEKIVTSAQLFSLVQRAKVGDVISLDVWRKGEPLKLRATITESGTGSAGPQVPANPGSQGRTHDPEQILQVLGIQVRDLAVPERMRGLRGVVVTAVAEGGLAATQVKPGDLVLAVNNSRISGASEFFLHLAASAAVQNTGLHLVREGKILSVSLPAIPRQE